MCLVLIVKNNALDDSSASAFDILFHIHAFEVTAVC